MSAVEVQHLSPASSEVIAGCDLRNKHWWVWMLLGVSFVNAGSMIGLTAMDLSFTVRNDNRQMAIDIGLFPDKFPAIPVNMNDPSFTFDIIMLLTVVLAIIFILRGLIGEKKFEIALYPLMFTVTLVYCVVEYGVNSTNRNYLKLARIIVGGVLLMVSIPLTVLSMLETIWPEFQIIGASDGLMGMFRTLRYFLALLKFDFYLMLVLAVLNLKNGMNSSSTDVAILFAVSVYAFLFLIIGSEAVKREKKFLVYLFIVLALLLPLWVPFQITLYDCIFNTDMSYCETRTMLLASSAISIGILGISTRCYILMQLLTVFRHFGYGLTDTAFAGLIAGESTSLLGRPRRGY